MSSTGVSTSASSTVSSSASIKNEGTLQIWLENEGTLWIKKDGTSFSIPTRVLTWRRNWWSKLVIAIVVVGMLTTMVNCDDSGSSDDEADFSQTNIFPSQRRVK